MNLKRFGALLFVAVAAGGPGTARAISPSRAAAAVTLPIHRFADAANKGDSKTEAALCTSPASVVDEFPPYVWQGSDACAAWASALARFSKTMQVTDMAVTLAKPSTLSIDGSTAYAVFPSTLTYRQREKPVKETGLWTFALRKTPSGWHIAAWAWTTTH
jgi:ketosteroid isomerase-like protein